MEPGVTLCLFCLSNGAVIKRDRHGRPYLSCYKCHARTFLSEDVQLRAYFAAVKIVYAKIGVAQQEYEREAEAIFSGQGVQAGKPMAITPAEVPHQEVKSA